MSGVADANEAPAAALPAELMRQVPFGPAFFLGQLRAFVRDRCPEPGEGLPVVELRLVDGEVLDLCHVIGVTPGWVALAVNETERSTSAPPMRTEIVPYECILRVTVRAVRTGAPHLGFDRTRVPQVLEQTAQQGQAPEAMLRAACAAEGPGIRVPGDAREGDARGGGMNRSAP